jgi:S-formylglutathione hydrolase FrmB
LILACAVPTAGLAGQRDDAALTTCTFEREKFTAKGLDGRSCRYGVYLPKGYADPANAEKTYPWAIWLHGMRGSLYRFKDQGATVYDRLRRDGAIPDMIMITPSAASTPLYMDGAPGGDEEKLILEELWNDVEKKFRVSKQRHERAIMGVSMGAFGAMKMALRFPQRFGAVAVHSGPVLPADPAEMAGRFQRYAQWMRIDKIFGEPIDAKKWAAEIPMALIRDHEPKHFGGLRIYFDAGTKDRYGFGPTNVEFSKALKARGIEHTFRLIEGGGHSWSTGAVQSAMASSLAFVGKSFALPFAPTKGQQKTKKQTGEAPPAVGK